MKPAAAIISTEIIIIIFFISKKQTLPISKCFLLSKNQMRCHCHSNAFDQVNIFRDLFYQRFCYIKQEPGVLLARILKDHKSHL